MAQQDSTRSDQVATGGTLLLAGTAGGRLLFYTTSIVLARAMPVSEVGLFLFCLALFQVPVLCGSLGFDAGMLRFGPRLFRKEDRESLDATLQGALIRNLATSLLLAGLIWWRADDIARYLDEPLLSGPLRVSAFALPGLVLHRVLATTLQALFRPGMAAFFRSILYPLLLLVLLLPALYILPTATGAVWAMTIAGTCAALAGLGWMFRRLHLLRRVRVSRWRASAKLARFSAPILLTTLVGYAAMWVDSLLVGYWLPPEAMARYGVAFRISLIGVLVLEAFNGSLGPAASHLLSRRPADLGGVYRVMTRLGLLVFLPLLGMLLLFPAPVLGLFGRTYLEPDTSTVLRILLLGQLVNILSGGAGMVLVMAGYRWLSLLNGVGTVLLTSLLCLIWIPEYGIVGASVASALGVVGVNLARLIELRALLSLHPFSRTMWKPWLAFALAVGTAGALRWFWPSETGQFVGIVLLGAVYSGVILGLGLEQAEKKMLSRLVGKKESSGSDIGSISPPEPS